LLSALPKRAAREPRRVVVTSGVRAVKVAVKRGGAARGGARAAPQRSPDLTEPYP